MKDEDAQKEWRWPLNHHAYDNTIALSDSELCFLAGRPKTRINCSEPRAPELAVVSRLIEPLEDVFTYIGVRKPKRNQLFPLLLEEMGQRQISFWGWRDQDWIEIAENHRYFASQLFNARDPMTLFELQEWLGHKHPSSTQHYIKISPTKLMKSYAKAGYFERNVRAIEVLIDQDVVRQGLAGKEPWKFFDLSHGYCTYDFFDQCPHRMACAQCSFYVPKESTRAQVLEAKANLLRLRQDIPLSESELAAVEEGIAAYEKLLTSLADVPTPDGKTPTQLATGRLLQIASPKA
jgi:hypothetical protein